METYSLPGRESELAKFSDQVFNHGRVIAVARSAHNVRQGHLKVVNLDSVNSATRYLCFSSFGGGSGLLTADIGQGACSAQVGRRARRHRRLRG